MQLKPSRKTSESAGSSLRDKDDLSHLQAVCCLGVLFLLYVAYAGVSLYRSSFVIEGHRYFCLFDDAMISMRYAANWADGKGLVWNPGEWVEGYSNFLWVGVMALIHLLPLERGTYALIVQIVCIAIGVAYVWGTYRLGRAAGLSRIESLGGGLLTAFYYPLTMWNLQGMETGLLTGLLVWTAALSLPAWGRARTTKVGGLLCGAALCTRPDALVLILAIFLLLALRGRYQVRAVAGTLGIGLSLFATYWVCRWAYYGSFWPNTYYLKLGIPVGFRIGVLGVNYAGDMLGRLGLPLIAVAILAFVTLGRTSRWDLLGVFIVCAAYTVWVGGDSWPYDRFLCPGIPFLALGLAHVLSKWAAQLVHADLLPCRPGRVLLAGMLIIVFSLNLPYAKDWLGATAPHQKENYENLLLARAISRTSKPSVRVAVFWAGVIPYFTKCYAIDVLGKSDSHIAREVKPQLQANLPPGHNKFDLYYSLVVKQADVVDRPDGGVWPQLPEQSWFQQNFEPRYVRIDNAQVPLGVRRANSAAKRH